MAEEDLIFGKNRHLFGGISPSFLKEFKIQKIEPNLVEISIILPEDSALNKNILSSTKGAIIRRKENEYPKTEFDGTLIANVETSTTLTDIIEKEKVYYYAAFPYNKQGVFCRNNKNRASINECEPLTEFKGFYLLSQQKHKIMLQLKCSESCQGIQIRRKENQFPENENDGEEKFNINTTEIKNINLTDTTIEPNRCYFYRAFPFDEKHNYNRYSKNNKIQINTFPKIYGFKINKNNPDPEARVTYTDDAVGMIPAKTNLDTGVFNSGSWTEDVFFRRNNHVWMVKSDGTPDYQLDDNDYTKKAIDGSPSDVSNSDYDGNAMIRFDTIWLRQWEDKNYQYCQISDQKPIGYQFEDEFHAYAHTREDGSIMDYIWLSAFEGIYDGTKLRSLKGYKPMHSINGENEISRTKANGNLWSTQSWSQINMINMLLILMSRNTNTQIAFGYGHNSGGSAAGSLLTTGSVSDKGAFYGTDKNTAMKVFHIENYWGDQWNRIQGCVTNSSSQILTKMTPPYSTSGSSYHNIGVVPGGTSGGYISAAKMTEQGLIPQIASGSETTYFCDGLWYAKSCYALVGGSCSSDLKVGAFCWNLVNAVSDVNWRIGAALSCEQKK